MNHLINKFSNSIKSRGIRTSIDRSLQWCTTKIIPQRYLLKLIQKRHAHLSQYLNTKFSSTVKYGNFEGLELSDFAPWGLTDRAGIIFGIYEKEVLDQLFNHQRSRNLFIDLGAADGYYGVGVLTSNAFDRSCCYEISVDGQAAITKNALLNGVTDRITVRGIAEKHFYKEFSQHDLSNCLVLVDIEGGEFELFDRQTFFAFAKATVIIELHDFMIPDGQEKVRLMLEESSHTHSVQEFTTGSRDLSSFPELASLHDYDRWLICSERRKKMQRWLRFDPLP